MHPRHPLRSLGLGALLTCLPAAPSLGQVYAFHSEIQGIYWNPELNGWGFSFDVQKGILFGAVFGYDVDGEPVFYTMLSEKTGGNGDLTFTGDVFLTRANGTATEAVGEFDLEFGRHQGQPALSIDMTSPSLNLDDFELVRFAYAESDRLGVLSGARVRTWFGMPNDSTDQRGTTWRVTNDRTLVDGQLTIDVLDDGGATGFAALVEAGPITTYVVFFPIDQGQTLTYDFDLLNDRGGQGVRLVLDDQGNVVGDYANFASAIVALDALSNKAGLSPIPLARRSEILTAFGRYLEIQGR